ncbi:MAG: hypothetical protein PQJ59_18030 [Spirochaetales bacterium]|nr:hypothetical protein [Spirochaetales bacterium]
MTKKVPLLICLTLFMAVLNSQNAPVSLNDWKVLSPGSSAKSVTLPQSIVGEPLSDGPYYTFTLTTEVTIPPAQEGLELYFQTGRMSDGFCEFKLNGVSLYQNGHAPPVYWFQGGIEAGVLLPPELIRYGKANTLSLNYITENPNLTIRKPSLTGYKDAIVNTRVKNFFNVRIYTLFAFLNLFIGLFYLLQFLVKRELKYNMLFSLANLLIGLYFYRISNIPHSLPFVRFYSLSKGARSLF